MHSMRILAVMLAVGALACGKPAPARGSGAKTTAAAKDGNQKATPQVTSNTSKATSSGMTKDGVACDASLEGVGFCGSDSTVVFCASGQWWALECSALDPTAFCGVDTDGVLDCWLPVEG